MSQWTHIIGIIECSMPLEMHRTPMYEYEDFLIILPKLTSSEIDVEAVPILTKKSKNHNNKVRFTIVGDMRDRNLNQTTREAQELVYQIAKKLFVDKILIKITDDWDSKYSICDNEKSLKFRFEEHKLLNEIDFLKPFDLDEIEGYSECASWIGKYCNEKEDYIILGYFEFNESNCFCHFIDEKGELLYESSYLKEDYDKHIHKAKKAICDKINYDEAEKLFTER